ncbi:NADPH-dependent 2,4-dienoyl-CoA reductase, partial [Salmonella enterica subsp. enterica serovar Anatum]|nr:NADPH-dependent 2,4-dienoyl-CoA reductase [Salmonella enterica subsp. enterica serovar Anatum]
AHCAQLAREAGYDGVEVMGSEGYLINEFLTRRTNHRDDEWGGGETVTSPVLDTVLTLSRRLNMLTVAEGVETPEQARWLRDHGVN